MQEKAINEKLQDEDYPVQRSYAATPEQRLR